LNPDDKHFEKQTTNYDYRNIAQSVLLSNACTGMWNDRMPSKVHRRVSAHRLHDRKAEAVDLFTCVSLELLLLEMRVRHFFSVGGLALLGQETSEKELRVDAKTVRCSTFGCAWARPVYPGSCPL